MDHIYSEMPRDLAAQLGNKLISKCKFKSSSKNTSIFNSQQN